MMNNKKIKLNILIIAAVFALAGISTAVLAVTGMAGSADKASKVIDDTYMTNSLTKAFGKTKADIVKLKDKEGTMDKVYYRLLSDRKSEIKTDKLVYDMYDKGYSLQDIDSACEYAAASGLSPEKILQSKEKDGRYELVKTKNDKGEEVEKVLDNNIKLWDAAANKLKVDFGTYASMLGSNDKTFKSAGSDEMSGRQKFDMLLVSHRYNVTYNDVYKEIKVGKKLPEIERTYLSKLNKESSKMLMQSQSKSAEAEVKPTTDDILISTYKITEDEIKKFEENGIQNVSEMAEAKHLAAKYKISIDKVIEAKKAEKEWEEVDKKLGGAK